MDEEFTDIWKINMWMYFFPVKQNLLKICQNNNAKNIQRTYNLAFHTTIGSTLEDGYHCASET